MTQRHTIHLTTKDGKTVDFECAEDQNVLDAAEEAGLTPPAVCRGGGCGTCKGNCSSGKHELTDFSEDALSADERANGDMLLCRTYPKEDLTVSIQSEMDHISQGPAKTFTADIQAVEDMGGEVRRLLLSVQPDENGEGCPPFEPGQFFELEIPGTDIWRAYSIANAPNWAGEVEFMIRLQPNGKFSDWIANHAKVGDTMNVRGPKGEFVLQQGTINPRCFVSGGTGVAPMLSMLRLMSEFGESNEAYLFFGVNEEKDLFGLEEIQNLKDDLPNLNVSVCVNKPSSEWTGYNGNPVSALKEGLDDLLVRGLSPEIYLCGPPGLIDAAKKASTDKGVQEDQVFSERFLPS